MDEAADHPGSFPGDSGGKHPAADPAVFLPLSAGSLEKPPAPAPFGPGAADPPGDLLLPPELYYHGRQHQQRYADDPADPDGSDVRSALVSGPLRPADPAHRPDPGPGHVGQIFGVPGRSRHRSPVPDALCLGPDPESRAGAPEAGEAVSGPVRPLPAGLLPPGPLVDAVQLFCLGCALRLRSLPVPDLPSVHRRLSPVAPLYHHPGSAFLRLSGLGGSAGL